MDLEKLLETYIDKTHHSIATEATYRTAISVFTRDTGVNMVCDITPEIVSKWKLQVLDRASGSTWNNYHRHLKALFEGAIRRNLIGSSNPFKQVEQVKNPIERVKVCSVSTIKDTLSHLESGTSKINPAWFCGAVIRMFYYTGMRRRQLVGLTWGDVNYEDSTLLMSATHSKTKKQWSIPITSGVHSALGVVSHETTKILGTTPDATTQIFNVTLFNKRFVGNEMTCEQLTGMFRKLRSAGYPLSPHKLRHTMATEICNLSSEGEATVTLRILQAQLGHSSINTTAKYMRPSMKAQKAMLLQLKTI